METLQFSDRQDSVRFYEDRYAHGYMGHWSAFEKRRLISLIRGLDLPPRGVALDFGCGRGIFTAVIREALPGWRFFGCDISAEAIAWAKVHQQDITFFVLGDKGYDNLRADFIHSHHVLEHTYDAQVTASEMIGYAAPSCTMLHSFPCNHPGSLEHRLSEAVREGIDPVNGKFFFEDSAHQRRLSRGQAETLFAGGGFKGTDAAYANQFDGAIKWIAESDLKLVLTITDARRAKDAASARLLRTWRRRLLFRWWCHFAATAFTPADRGKHYRLKRLLQVLTFVSCWWFAVPVDRAMQRRALDEWEQRRKEANGSDLFLVLRRG
jgi:SAM-dependent methyltransferase